MYRSFKDYIVPPQENNALFLMTNFIRTDQEHKLCAGKSKKECSSWFYYSIDNLLESPDETESSCSNDSQCRLNQNFQKVNPSICLSHCHYGGIIRFL